MIYFIQDSANLAIKIGFTGSREEVAAEMRLKALQTGNPSRLILLATMPGDKAVEGQLHQRFDAHCVAGEWFKPAPDLIRFILAHCAADRPAEEPPLLTAHQAADLDALARGVARTCERAFRRGYHHGHCAGSGTNGFHRSDARSIVAFRFHADADRAPRPPGAKPSPLQTAVARLMVEEPKDSYLWTEWLSRATAGRRTPWNSSTP